jgi:hypothetical protein
MEKLTHDQQRFLEGYAAALQDVEYQMTKDNGGPKAYDPTQCNEEIMHSYPFNMKDGGRHHPVKKYKDIEEIKMVLLKGATWNIAKNEILEEDS